MTRVSHSLLCGLALLTLCGCGRPPPPTAAAPVNAAAARDQLSRIVERYWDEHLPADNAISPQFLADSLSIERRYLAEVLTVPRNGLERNSQLTYDIFKSQRELIINGFTFPSELLPINPFGGMPQQFAAWAEDTQQYPLSSVAAYDNWLRRIDDYVRWTQQAIINMREGMRRGYTSPRVLVERMLPILQRLGADDQDNVLFIPLRSMPDAITEPNRGRLRKVLAGAISGKLLPANRALHDFLQQEYLPHARTTVALSELPLGAAWYAYRVKRATSTALSAAEIHRIGIAEVERIGAHPEPPHDSAPLAPDELLSAYKELAGRVGAAMPGLFSDAPADVEIRAVGFLTDPASALWYRAPGPPGSLPAVLNLNTGSAAPRTVSIASFLQQAVPGRQYQIAIQQGRADLPRFRRFGTEAAFTAGWGLYAASLGEELGLYADEWAKWDAVAGEMRCAVALVVDTGLHATGWTATVALEYLHAHLVITDADAQALLDYYVANPADAMACMMGKIRFRAMRARAQQSSGTRFDVREFHAQILRGGAMPMDLLEARMKVPADGAE